MCAQLETQALLDQEQHFVINSLLMRLKMSIYDISLSLLSLFQQPCWHMVKINFSDKCMFVCFKQGFRNGKILIAGAYHNSLNKH